MNENKYIIEHDLMGVKIKELNKSTRGYEKRVVKLTKQKLQEKIKEYESKCFSVEAYHQERIGNDYIFIPNGMVSNYKELRERLDKCRSIVEKRCREIIKNGKIDYIRNSLHSFDIKADVFGALLDLADGYKVGIIITFPTLLYLVECIGNIYDTKWILEELRKQGVYIHFLDWNLCTGIPDEGAEVDLEDLHILLNEYFLEDLLRKMYKENQLSYEKCREYGMSENEYEIYDPSNDSFDYYANKQFM